MTPNARTRRGRARLGLPAVLIVLGGFTFVTFGILAIALTVAVGAPTFTGWTGIAGVLSIVVGVSIWRTR